jgi:hypothetical protein
MDRPDVRRLYEQTAPKSASWWSPTQLQNPVLHEEKVVKNDYVREWMSGAIGYRIVRKVIGALTVLACCFSSSEIGKQILVQYSADYFFLRAEQ